ncbi:MAG TPA: hypothetical protein VFL61_00675 [Gaiellaceae bacterium]|nr:hypothetical protein [Gaiellaceae bacterium]
MDEQRKIELGPLFTAGAVVGVYGLARRRWLAVAAGVGAMWLDQRSELGLALRERFRPLLIQIVPDEDGRPVADLPDKRP